MIRTLRRRHRWLVRTLFAIVIVAAALALTHPIPSPRVDALPGELTGPDRPVVTK